MFLFFSHKFCALHARETPRDVSYEGRSASPNQPEEFAVCSLTVEIRGPCRVWHLSEHHCSLSGAKRSSIFLWVMSQSTYFAEGVT